jgi:2,4-dienoyl-CoA reductase-like NADH-dependent reductase (Old Yellow Enzyme family)
MRLPLEVVEGVRNIWPDENPLFYRISSTDGQPNGATIEDNVVLAKMLKKLGVDVVDCSSGGIGGSPILAKSKIIPGFQVPYSQTLKESVPIRTMAVGAIIDSTQANNIITQDRADLVALGRELLADTQWVYKAATRLVPNNAKNFLPPSYSFYLSRRDEWLDRKAPPA